MSRPRLLITGAYAIVCWLVLLLDASAAQTGNPKPIQLRLPTHICATPCDMVVTVVIPNHPDNRIASVVWSYSGSTDWPLGPDTQAVEFKVTVGKFEKGDHTIYAVLAREKDGTRETFEASQRISVR